MKRLALTLLLFFSLTTIFSTPIFAAVLPINVVVNDNRLNFPDAQPFVDGNGRTMIPAKYIGEALGATVTWRSKEQKSVFTFGKKNIVLYIGKKNYAVDGKTKQMDTTAILKAGRTFVPAKFIAEALGANVKWDGAAKTVYIYRTVTTQSEEGRDVITGTVVNNQDELLQALRLASHTLQPKVVLKCNNYKSSDYSFENLVQAKSDLYGVYNILVEAYIIKDVADITATITYSQVHRIIQSRTNAIALGRLSKEDTEVVNKINDIVSQVIKDTMTVYEKELAIHDYIVLNHKYDYDNYEKNTIPDQSYTPYGLLIKGTGVCQAYAEAAELLLTAAGIECKLVTGTSKGESHAWNVVKLDDEYYMLDVTWDDPIPDRKGQINYNYFNITADQLSQDHTWDKSKWHIANGTKYNYFIYNNLVVNNYSEFKQLVTNKIIEGKRDIIVYINNYNEDEYDLDFIFDYYAGTVSHTAPDTTNTVFQLILK